MNRIKVKPNKYESSVLYTVKAFAVLSVISAHCNYVNRDFSAINRLTSAIMQSFGTVGVGIFFLLSGYFFYFNRVQADKFIKSKSKSLLLPWLVTGTAVYLYVTCRKGGLSVISWVHWIIGDGSYLYYMSMLTVMYLIYIKGKNNLPYLILTVLISLFSRILTYMGLLRVNSYLNPVNWMIFFAVGLLIARYSAMSKLITYCKKWVLIYTVITAAVILALIYTNVIITYTSVLYIPFEALMLVTVVGISTVFNTKLFEWLGKASFSIYLLHMPIAGIIANIFNRFDIWYLTIARPFIVLWITAVLIRSFDRLTNRLNIGAIYKMIIGLR